jgi:hypothetical protein
MDGREHPTGWMMMEASKGGSRGCCGAGCDSLTFGFARVVMVAQQRRVLTVV